MFSTFLDIPRKMFSNLFYTMKWNVILLNILAQSAFFYLSILIKFSCVIWKKKWHHYFRFLWQNDILICNECSRIKFTQYVLPKFKICYLFIICMPTVTYFLTVNNDKLAKTMIILLFLIISLCTLDKTLMKINI